MGQGQQVLGRETRPEGQEDGMSTLSRLIVRCGDKMARRSELRMRVAAMALDRSDGHLLIGWVNEIATLSEEIGELNVARDYEIGARMRRRADAVALDKLESHIRDAGASLVPHDLALASGG